MAFLNEVLVKYSKIRQDFIALSQPSATSKDVFSGISDAEDVANAFAESYFNLRYKNSLKYCTKESEQWISFAASQINEDDIKSLRGLEEEASVEVENVSGDDAKCHAKVIVSNYFEADTIGKTGHIVDEGVFDITLVKEGNTWKVRMEGLPRSEKQSRD